MRIQNIIWNLIGLGLPLLIAALTVPSLLKNVGAERFGILALAWGLIGYAGALDLGIGRATTQKLAFLRDGPSNSSIPNVVATATRITLMTGCLGALAILLATALGAYRLIETVTVPAIELQFSMLLLAFALPMQAISATYRGVNEAYSNFRSISVLRVFLGAANFGAPWVVSLYSSKVHWLIATLVLSRALALVAYRLFARDCLVGQGHTRPGAYSREVARDLLHFGGWFTVSAVVGPFLAQADRFFVGAIVSAAAVAMYVIPYELTVQTLLAVAAVNTVTFPVITGLMQSSPADALKVFRLWLWRVAVVMAGGLTILALIMPYVLRKWIGPQVSDASIQVGQILCVGVFCNAIGSAYMSLLHANGRTRPSALLHLAELPVFTAVLYVLVSRYGIQGAAVSWVLRTMGDAAALVWLSRGSLRAG